MVKLTPIDDKSKLFDPEPDQFSQRCHSIVTQSPQSPPAGPPRAIATPCVKVCIVDGASGLCLGCFRSLAEIGGWSAMDEARRAEVMAELPSRRARIDPALPGPA